MSFNNDKQRQRIIFVNDTKIQNNELYQKFITLSEDNPNIVFFTDRDVDNNDVETYFSNGYDETNYSSKNVYIGGKKFVPIQGIATKQSSVIINDYMFTLSLDPNYGLLGLSKQVSFDDFEFVGIYSPYIIENNNIQYIYDNRSLNTADLISEHLSKFTLKNSNNENLTNILYNNTGFNTNLISDKLKNTICIVIKYKPAKSAINEFTEGPKIILQTLNSENKYSTIFDLLELESFNNHERTLFNDGEYSYISYFYKISNFNILSGGLSFIFKNFTKISSETNDVISDIPEDFIVKYIQDNKSSYNNIDIESFTDITEDIRASFDRDFINKRTIFSNSNNIVISPVIDEFETVMIQNESNYESWINTYPLYINSVDTTVNFDLSSRQFRIIPNRNIYSKNYDKLLENIKIYIYGNSIADNNCNINILRKIVNNESEFDKNIFCNLNTIFQIIGENFSNLSKANYIITPQLYNSSTYLEKINNIDFNLYNCNIKPFNITLSTVGTNLFITDILESDDYYNKKGDDDSQYDPQLDKQHFDTDDKKLDPYKAILKSYVKDIDELESTSKDVIDLCCNYDRVDTNNNYIAPTYIITNSNIINNENTIVTIVDEVFYNFINNEDITFIIDNNEINNATIENYNNINNKIYKKPLLGIKVTKDNYKESFEDTIDDQNNRTLIYNYYLVDNKIKNFSNLAKFRILVYDK